MGGGDEGWGWVGGVKLQKYTSVFECCRGDIFSEPRKFFVDDESRLSAVGSVR
jgi:hypothetical protein